MSKAVATAKIPKPVAKAILRPDTRRCMKLAPKRMHLNRQLKNILAQIFIVGIEISPDKQKVGGSRLSWWWATNFSFACMG